MVEIRKPVPAEAGAIYMMYDSIVDDTDGKAASPRWTKGVYPGLAYIEEAIKSGEMFAAFDDGVPVGAVIMNHRMAPGYEEAEWKLDAARDEIAVIHTLGVSPAAQHRGIASRLAEKVAEEAGRGGMITKNRVAARTAAEGIETVIANGRRDGILTAIVTSADETPCTRFVPAATPSSTIKRWIASSEGFAKGAIVINEGAAEAVARNKGVSILPVGVVAVEGAFEKDDIVRIVTADGRRIGLGRAACDSTAAERNKGSRGLKPVIHYDYLYIE